MLKNLSLGLALCSALSATSAVAATNPASAQLKIYGVAVSTNPDCSNAKVLNYNSKGTTYDLLANPTLFSGTLAAGTYQCVIMYMDDLLTFVPASNDGTHCVAGTTYQRVICNTSGGGCTFTTAVPDSNNIIQFTGSQSSSASSSQDITHVDKVLLFLSTQSNGNGTGAFLQPTSAGSANGIKLNGALTVTNSGTTGTFVVNFNGQIRDTGSDCDLGPPVFGFR